MRSQLATPWSSGGWSGLVSASDSAVTAFDGTVFFDSAKVPNSQSDEFVFAVTDVTKVGHISDSAASTETGDYIDDTDTACGGDPGSDPLPGRRSKLRCQKFFPNGFVS